MKKKITFTLDEIKEKVAHFCAYQDRCHWEVEQKLNELHAIPETKERVLLYLMKENFVNEERFARSYVRGKFRQKKWGRIKIKSGLTHYKITEKLQEMALTEIDEEEYFETLYATLSKKEKLLSAKNQWDKRAKLTRFLRQKGYEWNLIQEAITTWENEQNT